MAFNLTVKYRLITLLIVLTVYSSCTKEEYVTIDSKPVVADLTHVPYPKLSDYNFFEGALKNLKQQVTLLFQYNLLYYTKEKNKKTILKQFLTFSFLLFLERCV